MRRAMWLWSVIRGWWLGILDRVRPRCVQRTDAQLPEEREEEMAAPDEAPTDMHRKVKSAVAPRIARAKNIKELLDYLGVAFGAIRAPDDMMSWLSRDNRRTLRKIGIYVPHLFPYNRTLDRIPAGVRPVVMSLSLGTENNDVEDGAYNDQIVFAIREPDSLPLVEKTPGVPYLWGMAANVDGSVMWIASHMTVDSAGVIYFPKEEYVRTVKLPSISRRRTALGRAGKTRGGAPSRHISVRALRDTPLLTYRVREDGSAIPLSESMQMMRSLLANAFVAWSKRTESWSVAVTKGNNRLIFGVPREETKNYFADREIEAMSRSGQRRKILHYVSAHERQLKNGKVARVKEHVRGLREFNWCGYHCLITAPSFNGTLISALLDLPPIYEDEQRKQRGYITLPEMAKDMVEIESGHPL